MTWLKTESGTFSGASTAVHGAEGASLASASTVTLTDFYHQVSGTTTVNSFAYAATYPALLVIRPTGVFTIGTGGNIVNAPAASVVDELLVFMYDGTSFRYVGRDLDSILTAASTHTLSNKSIDLGSNTITGTLAQFNTALTDGNFVSIAGSETLTSKTLTSPTINSPTIPATEWASATHTHAGSSTGGTITTASISNYTGWTDVAHAGGNFTGNAAMTWTVASGDQLKFGYTKIGTDMWIDWYLNGTTVAGTPDTTLQITIPGSFTASQLATGFLTYQDNGGAITQGFCQVNASGTVIQLRKNSGNWTAATDTTTVYGNIRIKTTA